MKKHTILIITVICLLPTMSITASANEVQEKSAELQEQQTQVSICSAGIIQSCALSISSNGTALYLSAKTCCTEIMKTIGLKDIILQRSSNNSSWSDYVSLDDILSENTSSCSVTSKKISTVSSGYYYRITCTHYAKESGLFGSSQSIDNTSNSVWID